MEEWKYKAIDKLKDYSAQKVALQNIPDEIARLESEATSIRSATGDSTPVKGGGSRREDILLANIVNREELKAMLERAKYAVRVVDRGLNVLSKEERHILDVMYIFREKGAEERLMDEFGLQERSSLYKRVNKALLHFTIAMYGATVS